MSFCLSRKELEKLIAVEIEKKYDFEEDNFLSNWIENARNWSDKLIAFTYFISKIFEKRLKERETPEELLEKLYKIWQIQDSMWLIFQEFGEDFIKYILDYERNSGLSLEDELIHLQNKLSRFEYG